jgi:hypothetical protein
MAAVNRDKRIPLGRRILYASGQGALVCHAEKDETSRDIGIASLPLQACRPSGGFVLGTLSAASAAVKRF